MWKLIEWLYLTISAGFRWTFLLLRLANFVGEFDRDFDLEKPGSLSEIPSVHIRLAAAVYCMPASF